MKELLENPELVSYLVLENLLVIAVMAYYFLWQNKTKGKDKQDYEILKMLNHYYEQNLDSMKQRYDQISMMKHDMRNTLLVLDNLLLENQTGQARQLLGEQIERIDHIYQMVKTDNNFVNAILNQKLSEAKDKGIEVRCVILTSFQGIASQDICNLLGNLLDNGVEANEGAAGERFLELILEGDEKELEIICRNSTSGGVIIRENRLPETKKDRSLHGYGGRIIREIVNRYQGEIVYTGGETEIEALVKLIRNERV